LSRATPAWVTALVHAFFHFVSQPGRAPISHTAHAGGKGVFSMKRRKRSKQLEREIERAFLGLSIVALIVIVLALLLALTRPI
jgi:hypothetical protein